MPIKDKAARREYMKKYQAEYRQGKRRAESAKKVTGRTLSARAQAVKRRKKLWALENHEWRMQQQRERRRAARVDAERALLQELPTESRRGLAGGSTNPSGRKGSLKVSRHDKNKRVTTKQKAA